MIQKPDFSFLPEPDEIAPWLGNADCLEEQGSGASVKELAARRAPASRGRFSQRSSGTSSRTSPSIRLRSHKPAVVLGIIMPEHVGSASENQASLDRSARMAERQANLRNRTDAP